MDVMLNQYEIRINNKSYFNTWINPLRNKNSHESYRSDRVRLPGQF